MSRYTLWKLILGAVVLLLGSSACGTRQKTTVTPTTPATPTEVSMQADFVASGNNPTWAVEIDYDRQMRFTSTEKPKQILAAVPEPIAVPDSNATRYRADTEDGYLEVTIYEEPCVDKISGRNLPQRIVVKVKTKAAAAPKVYTGCGYYEQDYRLHDIWALESMDGKPIRAQDFVAGVPRIELNLREAKMYGYGSCNELQSTLVLKSKQLTFGPIVTTKKACPSLAFETRFTAILTQAPFSYSLADLRLKLVSEEHTLVFRKVD